MRGFLAQRYAKIQACVHLPVVADEQPQVDAVTEEQPAGLWTSRLLTTKIN